MIEGSVRPLKTLPGAHQDEPFPQGAIVGAEVELDLDQHKEGLALRID
jgi:hypothetical protein